MLDIMTYPYTPFDTTEDPALKNLTEAQRFRLALIQGVIYLTAYIVGITICSFIGCTTPRAVEEHHHHHYEADTAAVTRQVDGRLTQWHEEMTQYFQQRLEQYTSHQQQSEHQRETVTETITVSMDSLGREVRQEQRTISRDITRELQQVEQRLTQEYETRLHVAIDSVNSSWQQRFDSLSSHLTSDISHQTSSTPVGDCRPWYQRWWDRLNEVLVIVLIVAVLWLTKSIWMPPLKRMF